VDALLDDPVFLAPYRTHFSPVTGRPSIPIETYLRMMFLKHPVRARKVRVLAGV
jgi:IS5 family transposase